MDQPQCCGCNVIHTGTYDEEFIAVCTEDIETGGATTTSPYNSRTESTAPPTSVQTSTASSTSTTQSPTTTSTHSGTVPPQIPTTTKGHVSTSTQPSIILQTSTTTANPTKAPVPRNTPSSSEKKQVHIYDTTTTTVPSTTTMAPTTTVSSTTTMAPTTTHIQTMNASISSIQGNNKDTVVYNTIVQTQTDNTLGIVAIIVCSVALLFLFVNCFLKHRYKAVNPIKTTSTPDPVEKEAPNIDKKEDRKNRNSWVVKNTENSILPINDIIPKRSVKRKNTVELKNMSVSDWQQFRNDIKKAPRVDRSNKQHPSLIKLPAAPHVPSRPPPNPNDIVKRAAATLHSAPEGSNQLISQ